VTVIDVHAHVIVPEVLQGPGGDEPWRPSRRQAGGRSVITFAGRELTSVAGEFVDADGILAALERRGIDHVLLSPWVQLLSDDLSLTDAVRRCALVNDGLARLRAEDPARISVLGAVPLDDPPGAARVLEHLMRSGSFAGVEITASVGGRYLGDPRFEPLWSVAEETGALMFVHPTTRGFDDPVFGDHYLWNLVGNPLETTVAAAHLVLSGTMERHSGLRVLLAHGGGAVVALAGRLARGHRAVPAARGALHEPPEQSIRRFFFDTVVHDPAGLRQLVGAVGADHVLLGSDYPFDMGDPDPAGTVRAAGLDAAEERAVLGGSVTRLLGCPTAGREPPQAPAPDREERVPSSAARR
jgi:aminocarboxymuconate-semialdehyde decarboxylase